MISDSRMNSLNATISLTRATMDNKITWQKKANDVYITQIENWHVELNATGRDTVMLASRAGEVAQPVISTVALEGLLRAVQRQVEGPLANAHDFVNRVNELFR